MQTLRRAILVLAIVVAGAPSAMAQTCIGPVQGVPGQSNLPPHWFDDLPEAGVVGAQPPYNKFLTDPRWVRAGAITHDSGVGETSLFRVLHDSANVYLSWWIKSPPVTTAEQNTLYFGFVDSAGTPRIVRLQLSSTSPSGGTPTAPAGVPVAPTIAFMSRDPLTGKGLGAGTPGWLSSTARQWVNRPLDTWGFQVRLPKSEVQIAAGTFKFWFQAYTGTVSAPVARFTWPRGVAAQVIEGGFPVDSIFPDPGTVWDNFRPSSGPLDGVCASTGVSIDYDTVGTTNTPANRIFFDAVPPALSHPVNKFFARPRNFSGTDIPAGGIKATFRIANWGSMPNWEDGVPIADLWSEIVCGTDASTNTTACGTNQPNKDIITNGTTAGVANQIELDWALTNAQLAPFASGAKRADNCLLVELTSSMAPGLTFTQRSVRKNMIFAEASTFEHEADITIKGLAPLPAGRDVYIWIRTLNMPAKVDPKTPPASVPIRREGCGDPAPVRRGTSDGQIGLAAGVAAPQESVPVTDAARLAELSAAGQLCSADLDAVMPTYKVYVYYDTGERVTLGGQPRPILQPQGAFGYRMAHDGPLTGWRHQLSAQGFALEEVAPDFYRIAKVPDNGVVKVKTKIQALETNPLGFRLFTDLGGNTPHGSFGSTANGGVSFNAGVEYFLAPNTSVEGILGYHTFDDPAVVEEHAWQLSTNVKQYFGPGPWRVFVNGGAGIYDFGPTATTDVGFNFGGGMTFDLTPRIAVEGVFNHHNVTTTGNASRFFTLQGGVRIRIP